MVDKELRLSLVFNGTIYNYKELRQELSEMGYTFFSEGDSEVILKAYHAWGEKCVERFYGMFAFAVWTNATPTCSWRATASASSRSITRWTAPACASPPASRHCLPQVAWTPASTRSPCTTTSPCMP